MTNENQLIFALCYCAFMFFLFYFVNRYTPKKINSVYGYRTPRSMKNNETWTLANAYANKLMIQISFLSIIIPVSVYFIYPEENFLITVIGHTLLIFVVIFLTERKLWQTFDSEGKPK